MDIFVSYDSRKWFPVHGAALNGFWLALASELVVLASDPFQQQSSLGWQYLEWIKLGLKHTIIWSSFVPALILWLIHSDITEFLLFVIRVGHTVKEKGLFSQIFSFAFNSISFKTLTLDGHNQLNGSKIKYSVIVISNLGLVIKKAWEKAYNWSMNWQTPEGEKGNWISSHLWFQWMISRVANEP